jgi:hypothetical protein
MVGLDEYVQLGVRKKVVFTSLRKTALSNTILVDSIQGIYK